MKRLRQRTRSSEILTLGLIKPGGSHSWLETYILKSSSSLLHFLIYSICRESKVPLSWCFQQRRELVRDIQAVTATGLRGKFRFNLVIKVWGPLENLDEWINVRKLSAFIKLKAVANRSLKSDLYSRGRAQVSCINSENYITARSFTSVTWL